MPELQNFLKTDCIALGVQAATKEAAIKTVIDMMCRNEPSLDAKTVFEAVMAREAISPTAIGGGVAIPHALIDMDGCPRLGIAVLERPVDFGSHNVGLVDFLFVIVGSRQRASLHLQLLSKLARIVHHNDFRAAARVVSSASELMQLILREG